MVPPKAVHPPAARDPGAHSRAVRFRPLATAQHNRGPEAPTARAGEDLPSMSAAGLARGVTPAEDAAQATYLLGMARQLQGSMPPTLEQRRRRRTVALGSYPAYTTWGDTRRV